MGVNAREIRPKRGTAMLGALFHVKHRAKAAAKDACTNVPAFARPDRPPSGTSAIRGFSAPASMHRAARHLLVPLVLLVCTLCGLQTPQPHASRSHPCISRASRSGAFHARTPLVCSSCAFASFTRQHAPASTRLALCEPCAPALLASANLALRDPCAPAFPAPPTRPAPLRRPRTPALLLSNILAVLIILSEIISAIC